MATQVLIAHTGQRLQVDTTHFTSLDEFKAWVSRQSSIPAASIIALTPQGKTAKLQTVQTEKEIYIYDFRITQSASTSSSSGGIISTDLVSEAPLPKRYAVSAAPNSIADSRALQSWQELFRSRREWAVKIVGECAAMARSAQERYSESEVMMSCLAAAVENIVAAIRPLEPRYDELKKWATPVQAEYAVLAARWEQYHELARGVPISPAMVHFMTGKDVKKTRQQATLEDLVDLDTLRKAGRLAQGALRKFNQKVADLDASAEAMFKRCDELVQGYDKMDEGSAFGHKEDVHNLLEDISAVARKIDADYQTTLEYTASTRDVLQASKTAATHTERLLPTLRTRALEMDDMCRYAVNARNAVAADSVEFMRKIAEITSLQSGVKSQINKLNEAEEEMTTFDFLRLIRELPFMYASFVSEALRRREWSEKTKTDLSTLANEMALFQDEEMKRRRKWTKVVGNTYGPDAIEGHVPGLEVNLHGEDEPWPNMGRQDLDYLLETLRRLSAEPEVVNDVAKIIAELSSPTKQQIKRVKAFKNGSIHEAALGRSGLLLRGDDDLLRNLQDDKARMENKLKTAESRIRRLEDLLHRQSQPARPTLGGNLFQPQSNDSTHSVKTAQQQQQQQDRRRSSDNGTEVLVQRIAQLEAELREEKTKSAVFEKDLSVRAAQNDEANSTKKDLLGNMEALKREFVEERKSLEDEIRQLRERLEATESEIDHFDESRENVRAGYDEKVRGLEQELERAARERSDELLKARGQVDFLRNESRLQRERADGGEAQLQAAENEAKALGKRAESAEDTAEFALKALRDLHVQMTRPADKTPDDAVELVEAVAAASAGLVARVHNAETDVTVLRSELDVSAATVADLRAELSELRERFSAEEAASLRLRESLAEERAKVAALEGELASGREQLDQLRARMADGETGSETLRRRLEHEEAKTAGLAEDLASRQSQVGSLEEELRLFKERAAESQARFKSLAARMDARTERAKDLSQRLYSQNERLCRLLERMGFSVAREAAGGGASGTTTMVITKVPRPERLSSQHLLQSSANDSSDPGGSSSKKSGTASRVLSDSADLEHLYWMHNADPEAEADKYDAFLAVLGAFDMDAFAETVYRRVKDVEHLARKLQRDARAHRERAHALQREAHDKIAFRNFKEGDLALFLPTRNQVTGAWAAFNVGFPHFFLREQEAHRLRSREWLVARIAKIQERVVDLSKSQVGLAKAAEPAKETTTTTTTTTGEGEAAAADSTTAAVASSDNPFDLSDGLRWYLIEATEDKPGAPATPGLGKSTVAATNVDATADLHHSHLRGGSITAGSMSLGKASGVVATGSTSRAAGADSRTPSAQHGQKPSVGSIDNAVTKSLLTKSLDSRRSSTASSRKGIPFNIMGGSSSNNNNNSSSRDMPSGGAAGGGKGSDASSLRANHPDTPPQPVAASSPSSYRGGFLSHFGLGLASPARAHTPSPSPAAAAAAIAAKARELPATAGQQQKATALGKQVVAQNHHQRGGQHEEGGAGNGGGGASLVEHDTIMPTSTDRGGKLVDEGEGGGEGEGEAEGGADADADADAANAASTPTKPTATAAAGPADNSEAPHTSTAALSSTPPQRSATMPPPPMPATDSSSSPTKAGPQQNQPPQQRSTPLLRERSSMSVESPSKKSVVWDSLWSLDLTYDTTGGTPTKKKK